MITVTGIYNRKETPVADDHVICQSGCKQFKLPSSSYVAFISQQNTTISIDVEHSGLLLTGDIDLYNRDELISIFHLENISGETSSGTLILEAYKRWGTDCVHHLIGDFMFALWDEATQTIFCARDQLGQKPFYYHLNDNVFVFSNRITSLAPFSFAKSLNTSWIERFLLDSNTSEHRTETIYENINRLLPAHTLTISAEGFSIKNYWQLGNNQQQPATTIAGAAKSLREHICRAVELRLDDSGLNGVELSGGLDSSAVAAFAQEHAESRNKEFWSFSNILPEAYKTYFKGFTDESVKITSILQHLKIKNQLMFDEVQNDLISSLEKAVDSVGYPPELMINVAQQHIYAAAQANCITTLLSGFGGDEMVSANLYKVYYQHLINTGKLNAAAKLIQTHGYSVLRSYISSRAAFIRHILGVESANAAAVQSHKTISKFVYTPLANRANSKASNIAESSGSIKDWYRFKIDYPGFVERLETGYLITGAYNIRYRYPLLHPPLLDFFYQLPDEWNMTHAYGRAMFRKALQGLLPEPIVNADKARNTAVIPVLKIEMEQYFSVLKYWLLAKPQDHPIFQYIDRVKVEKLETTGILELRLYGMLKKVIMLTMFFDKQSNKRLHEI